MPTSYTIERDTYKLFQSQLTRIINTQDLVNEKEAEIVEKNQKISDK